MGKKTFSYILIIAILFFILPGTQAKVKDFIVVIDAGHGGKDPGAKGTMINEKTINLSVALKLGELISKKSSDVKVVYTRKSDVFVELDERANMANRCKADLFISIHTNSLPKRTTAIDGVETYTLGLARSDENLEVAKRENSVILLEDNYLQRYEGFDPNSAESYIIFDFIQNKHMEQSINFASDVQKYMVSASRSDRGVKQAGFLVLRKTGMPSVLIELGYICNSNEERYLASEQGQQQLANSIYNAFSKYKWEYDRKRGVFTSQRPTFVDNSTPESDTVKEQKMESAGTLQQTQEPPVGSEKYILNQNKDKDRNRSSVIQTKSFEAKEVVSQKSEASVPSKTIGKGQVVYKVQVLTSNKKLSSGSKLFKGYTNLDFYQENGIYKYTYGETTDFDEIKKLRKKASKDFKGAFIVAFKDGEKVKYN